MRGGAPRWAQQPGRSLWAGSPRNCSTSPRGRHSVLGRRDASLAVGLSIVGAQRQRELERALRTGGHDPLRFRTVALFTVGGVALAVMTVVLVIAQT